MSRVVLLNQYSLRALLIMIFIISVALARETESARRQAEALRELMAHGALITSAGQPIFKVKANSTLLTAFGVEPRVIEVVLLEKPIVTSEETRHGGPADYGAVCDDDLATISDIYALTDLTLYSERITRRALHAVSALPRLRRLELGAALIRDGDLAELQKCRQLTDLTVFLTTIGDGGLQRIGAMSQLRRLCVSHIASGAPALHHLGGLRNLELLVIYGDDVPPEALARLSDQLPQCVIISESGGQLSIGADKGDTFD